MKEFRVAAFENYDNNKPKIVVRVVKAESKEEALSIHESAFNECFEKAMIKFPKVNFSHTRTTVACIEKE